MSHWLLTAVEDRVKQALGAADNVQREREQGHDQELPDADLVLRMAGALELVVLDLISEPWQDDNDVLSLLRKSAADAFRLYRVLPRLEDLLADNLRLLRMSALAVLGDRAADASGMLQQMGWCELPPPSDWRNHTWGTLVDVWLRLIRQNGSADRDAVLRLIEDLRTNQAEFEKNYLDELEPQEAKAAALELIGLYHVAKAAEILALFIPDGGVDGNHQVRDSHFDLMLALCSHFGCVLALDSHFGCVLALCADYELVELEPLSRLLAACSRQLVENSLSALSKEFVRADRFFQAACGGLLRRYAESGGHIEHWLRDARVQVVEAGLDLYCSAQPEDAQDATFERPRVLSDWLASIKGQWLDAEGQVVAPLTPAENPHLVLATLLLVHLLAPQDQLTSYLEAIQPGAYGLLVEVNDGLRLYMASQEWHQETAPPPPDGVQLHQVLIPSLHYLRNWEPRRWLHKSSGAGLGEIVAGGIVRHDAISLVEICVEGQEGTSFENRLREASARRHQSGHWARLDRLTSSEHGVAS